MATNTAKDFPVSILLISYNNFKYIFEALDSIFRQTYSNIQLIISDDASANFNIKKLNKYLKSHRTANISEIIVNVNSKNMGTVAHLEYLHTRCKGELITVIAADDAYADEYAIERLVKEYIRHDKKIGVITSLLAMCGEELSDIKSIFTSDKDVELINSGDTNRLFEELSYRCIMPSSGTAITPAVFSQIGSLLPDYRYVEDWSSHLRMARMNIQIRCIKHITVLHRGGGVSHGNTRANNNVYLQYYHDLLTLYEKEIEPYISQLSGAAAKRATQYYLGRCNRYKQDLDKAALQSDKKKVVFFFRKGIMAKGDFALYYRIAEYMVKNTDYEIFCVNNSYAEIQKNYLNSGIHFCEINSDNLHCFENATFILAYNQLFFLLEEIGNLKNAKLLLLFLHPQIYKWMSLQVSPKFNHNSVFKMLKQHNAYGFMDKSNLLAVQKHSKIQFEERYFPVVLDKIENEWETLPIINRDEINIAWFGRLDGDKINSFTNFLDNLIGFDFGKPITVHLIGDGNAKERINLKKYSPQMRFVFNSYMYGEDKDNYLRENADLVVAMGICALNAATLKLPTVLPIVSTSHIRSNKFILFNDTKDYCLGTNEDDVSDLGCKTYTASDVIDLIYSADNKQTIGEECYNCACENFSLEAQAQKYIDLIANTTLTVKRCKRNASIAGQLRFFHLYRTIRKKSNYATFLLFRQKLNGLAALTTKGKLKKLLAYVKGRLN